MIKATMPLLLNPWEFGIAPKSIENIKESAIPSKGVDRKGKNLFL
jgi:hypothetical protein